jgi:SAM-dependent methyltransferase
MTRDDYDAWAATYDVVDNPLVAMSTFALDDAVRAWSGARVLELGCGTARNAAAILAGGAREYIGLDASGEMLARGRARLGEDPRVRLIEGDVRGAPREAFDVVLFCLVLEHFETLAAPLAAAAAALRAGGELRIFELHPTWWHEGARAHYVVDGTERALAS